MCLWIYKFVYLLVNLRQKRSLLFSKKILCVGEILWDSLPAGLFLGGAPFNVACHLKMLGHNVKMLSKVGNDTLGEQAFIRAELKGIPLDYIQIDKKYKTGIVNVKLDKLGNAEYDIVKPAAWDFIELDNKINNNFEFLIYGSLAQRNEISRKSIEELTSCGSVNIFDVNLRPPYISKEVIEKSLLIADIVKMNEDELKQISGWFNLGDKFEQSLKKLAEKFNCKTVCITMGANGSAIFNKNNLELHKGFNVFVKDTVGSGDAFLAAFLHGIINNKSNKDIIEFANAVGAFVASNNGATPALNLDEINKIIKK